MKYFKTLDEMLIMNNKELIKYYQELRIYNKLLLDHAKEYFVKVKDMRAIMKYRMYSLGTETLKAEKDRANCDIYENFIKTLIH